MFGRFFKIGGRLSSMLRVNVALPNGHAEVLTLPPSSVVQDVRMKAQRAFGKKCLRLITAKNRVLVNFAQTLRVPYSSGTSTTTASNKKGLCIVVSWK